ncbi:MAG: DNA polymerase III subunit alpha [Firmicutes bacterium]|nr:DNA polymerase III subunit alpha [Bacillota bacterium]
MSVQLYTHSDYSLLESVLSVEDLVRRAANLGINAVALTDHNTTAGHFQLERYCAQAGLKPIFGLELDVVYQNSREPSRLVALALNNEGYANLLRLASQPTPVDYQSLPSYVTGVTFLEGGRGGELTNLVKEGKEQEAHKLHTWFEQELGLNYYIRHELGQDLDLFSVFPHTRFVLCQDVRFADPESTATLEVLAQIKGSEPEIPPYPLLSFAELSRRFQGPREVIENTLRLAESCQVKLPRERIIPPHPSGSNLEDLVLKGARERYGELSTQVRERLEHELKVIRDSGFEDYFLIVADIVNFAKNAKIPVGPGRGSAASSIVSYVLGITDVDPLAWNLLFERFLNAERASRPDIDLDFCYERRGEVLSYVAQRFGREHVAQIGTYGTFGPRAASGEVRRVLGRENPGVVRELQGLKRHRATHAAGVIITSQPTQMISAVYSDREVPVTHLDMYALEDLGVLKIDLLGLRTLTLQRAMEVEIQKREPEFYLNKIPLQDDKTCELLGRGQSLGIFQLESDLFQDLLKQLKPNSFQDIVALLALGRPGPLSMFPEYVIRRKNPSKVQYLHPELKEILGETYGLILYQEQVMTIAHRLGGLSLGEADLLRRALTKDDAQAAEKWKDRFVTGAQAKVGLSADAANKLFREIVRFSGYAFNKAHSVSYALLTWRSAYLKSNYPGEFFLTFINQGGAGKERSAYLAEAQGLGVRVLCPNVLFSEQEATLEGRSLRLGLATTRHITPHQAQQIIEQRKNRRWSSFCQFRRQLNLDNKTLEGLVLMGALDDLGARNNHLLELQHPQKSALELLKVEKELLGVYASDHPCSPFLPFVDKLRGELDVRVGEILETRITGKLRQGILSTPHGHVYLKVTEKINWCRWEAGERLALFGQFDAEETLVVNWALPLGPTLLITPQPEDLEIIKEILEDQGGNKPAILLIGESYHLLPQEYWVTDTVRTGERFNEKEIVYTWLDPWKENV